MLDTGRYLGALWDATVLLAESEATPRGTGAELRIQSVTSLRRDLGEYDAVVVAAGAAAGSLAELSAPGALPLKLQGGHVLELVPPASSFPATAAAAAPAAAAGSSTNVPMSSGEDGSSDVDDGGSATVSGGRSVGMASAVPSWDAHRPGILGSPYIAPLGPARVLVGATKELNASTADARRAGAVYSYIDGSRTTSRHRSSSWGEGGGASSTDSALSSQSSEEMATAVTAAAVAVNPKS